MKDLYLQFADKAQAIQEVNNYFGATEDYKWSGEQTFSFGAHTIVHVTEPVQTDEQGEPLPPTWTGYHVNIYFGDDSYNGELSNYEIEVTTPVNKRA